MNYCIDFILTKMLLKDGNFCIIRLINEAGHGAPDIRPKKLIK